MNTGSSKPTQRVPIKHLKQVDFCTLADDLREREQWLVEPLIAAHRSTSIVAEAGVGKSLIMLEISAALATGQKTFHRPAGDPVSVVYIDMEMTLDDLAERLMALGYDFTNDTQLQSNLHYYHMQDFKPFDSKRGGQELLAVVRQTGANLVVIDTLAGVVDGEENSADTYRGFAFHTGRILTAEGVTTVRLDHLGKNATKGARGSSAKRADVDVEWQMKAVARTPGAFKFTPGKTRIRWVPPLVDIVRTSETPLSHDVRGGKLSERAANLVLALDKLDVDNNVGRGRAKQALAADGFQASTGDLADAVAARKRRTGQVPQRDSWKTAGQ